MQTINSTKKQKIIAIAVSVFSALVAVASWVFNMGWLRMILTFLLFPIFHIIGMFVSNIFAVKYFEKSSKIKVYSIVYNISFVLFYLLLPDGGDVGGVYVLFGLIKNSTFVTVAGYLAELFAVLHIVMFILQMVEISRTKKRLSYQKKKSAAI